MRRSKGKGRGGKRKDKEKEKEEKQEVEKCYTAQVFYIPKSTKWLMHFTIVCDLELCLKVCLHSNSTFVLLSYNLNPFKCQEVEIFYTKLKAEAGPYLDVVFDNDEVVLEIPEEGKTLPSGWTLQSLFYPPRVRKLGKPFTLILFHGSVSFFFSFCEEELTATNLAILSLPAKLS